MISRHLLTRQAVFTLFTDNEFEAMGYGYPLAHNPFDLLIQKVMQVFQVRRLDTRPLRLKDCITPDSCDQYLELLLVDEIICNTAPVYDFIKRWCESLSDIAQTHCCPEDLRTNAGILN